MKINQSFLAIVLLRHENLHRRFVPGALKLRAVILSRHILGHENIHCLISVQALEFQTLVTKYYRERVRSRLRSSKDKRGNNAISML